MYTVEKQQNDLNTVVMRKWNEIEMNILFTIIFKICEKSINTRVLTFEEVKTLASLKKNLTKKEFISELVNISSKLATLNYVENSKDEMVNSLFFLFQNFIIDKNKETLTVSVHPNFAHIFNKIGIKFTQIELQEFVDISSTYAKTVYRLLKQYRTVGCGTVTLENFKALLEIPESHRSSNIDQKILTPILDQLGGTDDDAIFKNLKVIKNKKKGRGRGGVLYSYTFTFDKDFNYRIN